MSMDAAELWSHWGAMVRAAASVLRSGDEAEECAAAAVVQLLERQCGEVTNLEALAVTVSKRRAIDMIRAQTRARARDVRLAQTADTAVVDVAEGVIRLAEARWVDAQARDLLSGKTYEMLRLVADGHTAAEVADQIGATQRAVESHLLRARRTLREALARTLAVLAVFGIGVRRGIRALPSGAPALMMVGLVSAPFVSGFGVGRVVQPARVPAERVIDIDFPRPVKSIQETLATSASAGPRGNLRTPTSTGMSASNVATLRGPAKASATVTRDDTGGGEEGPVEAVLACVENLAVTPEEIGC